MPPESTGARKEAGPTFGDASGELHAGSARKVKPRYRTWGLLLFLLTARGLE